MDGVKYYETREEAEKDREALDLRKKVKTDVFRVKHCEHGFYIEQDLR